MPINHRANKQLCLSTIVPINHHAYQPSCLLTIMPIDHHALSAIWPSFTTFKPFGLLLVYH